MQEIIIPIVVGLLALAAGGVAGFMYRKISPKHGWAGPRR